ncbi:type I-E CRISPR-associated protein Cse2/CasB [Frankia sp. CNm7]|uniref:Type I-E CRISPR-associated protein Cse2/CasB n=1 Tax=Frankia nepalensis TaxID=1836974 RepID=A0A937UNS8_9ACTN|nr:type I-E CRISPR-associated protein Cse2/CasB [Frankia nepalensis]MBL7498289.1 type I-E CRISPR-associated protein Cse2/CasB [Frankia nepalensis]MBL7509119.1 type I-E CRISPR-associated protein Cse2/CasB [Frankia nepalensis]MBL7520806.1 type I-E CRISPR-associated protein Cse2/CasB [Frankia nepalensis]MBL7630164.1 type I-E CRISPR-associated protein Cse2/CasB [Frankia nepalensis]
MTTDSDTSATPSHTESSPPPFFWERTGKRDLPDGADLAALRRGVGREAGTVPAMWEHYRMLNPAGRASAQLKAEHEALVLYAIHQQSVREPMHQPGVGLGSALLKLRESGRFSPEAVDRRFGAAATATSLDEAAYHLRGLVRQLRQVPLGLSYTQLFKDLVAWQSPDRIGAVRRRWGTDYFIGRNSATNSSPATSD